MGLFRRDPSRAPGRSQARNHDGARGFGRLDDPGAAFDLPHERQLRALRQLRASTAQLISSAKRLEVQSLELKARRTRLEEQARRAVAAGREAEAVDALTQAQALSTQVGDLDARVAQLGELRSRLEASACVLEDRVLTMGAQAETMRARYGAAGAAAGLGTGDGELGQLLQQARDKIEWTQARDDALGELRESAAVPGQVQARLAELKAELAPGGGGEVTG